MTTSSPPVMTLELLQQFSDAWTAGDVDRLMELMTDDRVDWRRSGRSRA
jgi:ketosteroid isomerase-like protein